MPYLTDGFYDIRDTAFFGVSKKLILPIGIEFSNLIDGLVILSNLRVLISTLDYPLAINNVLTVSPTCAERNSNFHKWIRYNAEQMIYMDGGVQ